MRHKHITALKAEKERGAGGPVFRVASLLKLVLSAIETMFPGVRWAPLPPAVRPIIYMM
jgi:hypothetical protein